jgi:hypothetical protein
MTHAPLLPVLLLALSAGACTTPRSLVASLPPGRPEPVVLGTVGLGPVEAPPGPAEATSPALRGQDDAFDFMRETHRLRWPEGAVLTQGFLGFSGYTRVEVENGVDGDDGDLDQLPVIGGGAQWKFGGRRVDLGLEGMLSFSGRANVEAFAVGGGGAAVLVDVDILLFELFGGPFASVFLGEKLRLYGGAGPLMQWASYDQTGSGMAADGTGFGSGWYARGGFELALPSSTLVGFGVRWSDTSVDLGSDLGDMDIDGVQVLFTMSRWL